MHQPHLHGHGHHNEYEGNNQIDDQQAEEGWDENQEMVIDNNPAQDEQQQQQSTTTIESFPFLDSDSPSSDDNAQLSNMHIVPVFSTPQPSMNPTQFMAVLSALKPLLQKLMPFLQKQPQMIYPWWSVNFINSTPKNKRLRLTSAETQYLDMSAQYNVSPKKQRTYQTNFQATSSIARALNFGEPTADFQPNNFSVVITEIVEEPQPIVLKMKDNGSKSRNSKNKMKMKVPDSVENLRRSPRFANKGVKLKMPVDVAPKKTKVAPLAILPAVERSKKGKMPLAPTITVEELQQIGTKKCGLLPEEVTKEKLMALANDDYQPPISTLGFAKPPYPVFYPGPCL